MTARVTVGCKLPNGILLEMGAPGTEEYRSVPLKGANSSAVVGGFGLTDNVDEALFDAWIKRHEALPWARQQLVFKMDSRQEAEARALDNEKQTTGFERLDPKKAPKGVTQDDAAMANVRAAVR